MPVDASIYGGLLRPPKSVADYATELDQAQQSNIARQGAQINLIGAKQQMQDDQALRKLYGQPGFDASNPDSIRQIMSISPKAGIAAQKALLETQKAQADIGETKAKAGKATVETAGLSLDQQIKRRQDHVSQLAGVGNVDDATQWITDAVKSGELPADKAAQVVAGLKSGQVPFAQWRQQAMMGGLTALDQIKAQQEAAKVAETGRHNVAEETNATGQLQVSRGQLAVAQSNVGLRRDELAFNQNQPKGVITQTDQGPVLADPRTGVSQPLTMGGNPLGPKLQNVPATANTAIIANTQNINKIDQAIDLLDGKKVGSLEGDSNATGLKGYLPNGALNRMDPSGVDTRAAISDIGSLIIHDRSGAAVTASESPRLLPFIPLATDDKATARKKLVRFKQVYQQEQDALQQTYSRDAGYNTKPASNGGGWKVEKAN